MDDSLHVNKPASVLVLCLHICLLCTCAYYLHVCLMEIPVRLCERSYVCSTEKGRKMLKAFSGKEVFQETNPQP